MIDVENNYNKFKNYLTRFITRPGIDKFITWLDKSDAKIAPASTKYHLSEEGGLIQHSLNVFNRLIRMIKYEYGSVEDSPYSQETIALISLLHDVSKVNFYSLEYRNAKNESGTWVKVSYYSVRPEEDRLFYGSHSENSVYMLKQFFNLSYEEEIAILYHMNGIDTSTDVFTPKNVLTAYKRSTLALLLAQSDMQATAIDEVESTKVDE